LITTKCTSTVSIMYILVHIHTSYSSEPVASICLYNPNDVLPVLAAVHMKGGRRQLDLSSLL